MHLRDALVLPSRRVGEPRKFSLHIMNPIRHIVTPVIPMINLLTKSRWTETLNCIPVLIVFSISHVALFSPLEETVLSSLTLKVLRAEF